MELSNGYGSFRKTDEIYDVTFERRFNHPVRHLWEALTQADKLAGWFAELVHLDLRQHGQIHLRMHGMEVYGQILFMEPEKVLEYTWTSPDLPGVVSILRFELFDEGEGKSRLLFKERLVTSNFMPGVGTGWHFGMDALALVLAGEPIPEWPKEENPFPDVQAKYREMFLTAKQQNP